MTATERFETKSEWVYAQLRERIARGDVRSGERLRLGELAREFDTSVMPVREALRMLQRDGLILMESHRGASVVRVTWEGVIEAVMIRMHLETLAAREATPLHDRASLNALTQLVDRLDGLAERARPTEFSEANRRLHTLIVGPCPYPQLKEEIQRWWDAMWRTRSRSLFRMMPERMSDAQTEHRRIVEAIRSGNSDAVSVAADDHMASTLRAWREIARRDPPIE